MYGAITFVLASITALSGVLLASYSIVARIPAGDGGWDLASVNPIDERLYVAHGDGATAIDLRTGIAKDRIVAGRRVHAALAIPGTHDVLSTNGETNDALLFDGRTGAVRATITTGKNPDAAAYDPASKTVWIFNPGSGNATVIDPASAKIVATVEIGGSLELGVADGQGRMFVNIEDKNEVVVLDTKRRAVTRHITLQGCDGPTGIAYDPTTKEIVSACANGVAVISSREGRHVASLPIGKGADGAAFDAKRQVALIPAGKDGILTVIRLSPRPQVIGRVATAASARTIALDSATGRVYLPSATLAPSIGNARPKPIPGSFRVLVLAPVR